VPLTSVTDGILNRHGKGTVHLATMGVASYRKAWAMRHERRPPKYVICWDEVPVARE